ncbi:hypothetical protein BPY_06670 [Bifidobacterium psychraerophilum]|uniref:helix-turn-helix domain-containing protein n=1 Tax=Bifidobacterium psychraerophilum TaxID=218140 RepID=UPI00310F28C3
MIDTHGEHFKWLRRMARRQIDNDKGLIKTLKSIREEKHLSQGEVAFRMGVTQPAVSAIEKGNSDPNLGTIRRYANALGYVVSFKVAPYDEGWVDTRVEMGVGQDSDDASELVQMAATRSYSRLEPGRWLKS